MVSLASVLLALAIYVVCSFLLLIASSIDQLALIVSMAVVFLFLIFMIYFMKNRKKTTEIAIYLAFFAVLLNFFIVGHAAYLGIRGYDLRMLSAMKLLFVLPILFMASLEFSIKRGSKAYALFVILMILQALHGILAGYPAKVVIAQLINGGLGFFIILVYFLGGTTRISLYNILFFAIFLLFYDLVAVLDPNFIYLDVQHADLAYEIRGWKYPGMMPNQLFSSDQGLWIFRYSSLFGDPIIAGYFFSTILIVFLEFLLSRGVSWARLVIGVMGIGVGLFGLLMAHSKGASLLAVLYLLFRGSYRVGRHTHFIMVFLSIFAIAIFSLKSDTSAKIHFAGFVGPFSAPVPEILLGHGFGGGGNLAFVMGIANPSDWLQRGAESGIGALVYQAGVLVVMLLVFVVFREISLQKRILVPYMSAIVVIACFQENIVTISVSLILGIGAALLKEVHAFSRAYGLYSHESRGYYAHY